MKKLLYILGFVIVFSVPAYSQLADPGTGGGGMGAHDPIPGGGAPVGSGLVLVIGMGLAYGAKKTFMFKSEVE